MDIGVGAGSLRSGVLAGFSPANNRWEQVKSSDRRRGLCVLGPAIAGAAELGAEVPPFRGSVNGGIGQQHASGNFEGQVRAVVPAGF